MVLTGRWYGGSCFKIWKLGNLNGLGGRQFATHALKVNVGDGGRVRVRFAPSPTGLLHLGGLRTALFNYLLAKKTGGTFILRIEDTDQELAGVGKFSRDALDIDKTSYYAGIAFMFLHQYSFARLQVTIHIVGTSSGTLGSNRIVPGACEKLVADLKWAGLSHDEGPDIEGAFGPYIQSQRLEVYTKHVQLLLESGHAYRCFCSPEKLEAARMAKKRLGLSSVYDGSCRGLDPAEVRELLGTKRAHVIRFKSSDAAETYVKDEVRDQVRIKHAEREDFILLKSDGFPTYHLASVVDDHLMAITHVLRGEEWLMSLDKHYALYAAFGWAPPRFVHLPLLLNPDGTKLSKRSGDVHCEAFKGQGYLAEAIVNFVALLGWSPSESGNEVMGMQELIRKFSIDGINLASPKVFYEKLRWFNQQHLIKLIEDPVRRASLVSNLCVDFRHAYSEAASTAERFEPGYVEKILGRVYLLNELVPSVAYFFVEPDYLSLLADASSAFRRFFDPPSAAVHRAILARAIHGLQDDTGFEDFSAARLDRLIQSTLEATPGITKRDVQLTLRLSLTASKMGPPLNDVIGIIGRKCALLRLTSVLECLQTEAFGV
ncbi:Glutamate--tRNA ligase mitochondrial [Massospora cicadina]|nr:Glutamate--tRNA ligase mitochondrial [Massospora cicadina]